MTRPLDRHLDSDELDALVLSQAPGVSVARRLSEEILREVQRHVESCQDCDRKVQMHRSAQNAISLRVTSGRAPKGSNCSEESEWVGVAAGLLEEGEAKERMNHAAQCGHCGPLLKAAVKSLSDEATPDEEAEVAELGSARPDWQAEMARALQGAGQSQRLEVAVASFWKALLQWPPYALAAAVLALLVITAWIGIRTHRTSDTATLNPSPNVVTPNPPMTAVSTEQLLAQAYTEHRTIDVRIEGAKYGPLRVKRNDHISSFDEPQSLRAAVDIIGSHLQTTPEDPDWLHAKGQAQLLEGAYDEAIETLQRAQALRPESAEILTDLGSAYYLRGRSKDNDSDYGFAINWLGKALSKSPDNATVLFNRALACDKLCPTQAVTDWENYLKIDRHSDWADEARAKLAVLKKRLKQFERSIAAPLLAPSEIAVREANPRLSDEIDNRIEEYLHIAITTWLPAAFPEPSTPPSAETENALVRLSQVLEARHGDAWLADLLNQPKGEQFVAGIQTLSSALRADDSGDYSAAQQSAHRAAEMLTQAHNSAGALRAWAEEVYADDLLHDGSACLALLPRVQAHSSHYAWLSAQMSLEKSNCSDLVGDLGEYESEIQKGKASARENRFNGLYLRALGFEAQSKASSSDRNDLDVAFRDVAEGLSRFRSQHVDLMKGYNFYTDLDTAGDTLRLPYFQVVVWSEATAIIDRHPDILQKAMAHRWYANAAYLADMPLLAEGEFEKAAALLRRSPQTAATIRDYLDAEVWLAELETRKGDLDRATSRLQDIEPILTKGSSFVPEIRFAIESASLAMKKGDSIAAGPALTHAIFLAEWALRSFPAEKDRRIWAQEAQGAYRNLVEWKLRQGDTIAALELWEWFKGAALRAENISFPSSYTGLSDFSQATSLPSPTGVHDRLASLRDRTIVTFATFSDGIAVWVFDDRGIISHWIPEPEQTMRERAERFLRYCSSPKTDIAAIRSAGSQLYNTLISPVADQLESARTLIIEPDGYLADLPWEALVRPDGRYLIVDNPVVIGPGLYRMTHLHVPVPIQPDTSALIVSIADAPGLQSLPDVDREAEEVAKNFKSAHWLHGKDVSLAVIQNELHNVELFHFAGHALSSRPRIGLALATTDSATRGPQLLGAEQFDSGHLERLKLAVLSACSTGADKQSTGLVSDDLARSLLDHDVPHVVASRWDVDSTQTALFMKQFYRQLFAGRNVATAVQSARLTVASQLNSQHPYYWAAFELAGTN